MAQKQIAVSEQVHAKVSKISRSNYRGMGDQVAYWADRTCDHPVKGRVALNAVVAVVEGASEEEVAHVGESRTSRGFFCSRCQEYVFPDLPDDVNELINQPASGTIS